MNAPPVPPEPGPLRILSVVRGARVLWRVLPWATAAAFLVAAAALLGAEGLLLRQAAAVAAVLLGYGLFGALLLEVLAPERSELRLVPLSDYRARRLTAVLRVLAAVVAFTGIAAWLVESSGGRASVVGMLRMLREAALVFVGAGTVVAVGLPTWLRAVPPGTWRGILARFAANVLLPLAVAGTLFVVVAAGLGYVPLARAVGVRLLGSALRLLAAVVAFHYLRRGLSRGVQFLREGRREGEEGGGEEGEPDATALGIDRIGAGVLRILTSLLAALWILALWGLTPAAILAGLDDPVVSGGELTWGRALGGIVTVAAVLFLGWLLRNVLTYFVFPGSKVGIGARYAILAVLRYAVVALAVVFSLSAVGVDTASLGWFLGAAGIGLGLGLQDVIGNFFGGLIVLIERPIRVGDVVQIGEAVGTVEAIRMRGTTLRTFDNTTTLIPNRSLLGERVTNLSYGMGHARVTVDVGVSYDADPQQVRDLLLALARTHPGLLSDPAPLVWFQRFGESSLDFTLAAWTDRIRDRMAVASDLRYSVHRALKAAGIRIPYPQREVRLRTDGPLPERFGPGSTRA